MTASPSVRSRFNAAEHEPAWETEHVRVTVELAFPADQPARLVSKPGFVASSTGGGGGGGGGVPPLTA